jgi:hypothetical protein
MERADRSRARRASSSMHPSWLDDELMAEQIRACKAEMSGKSHQEWWADLLERKRRENSSGM